MFISLVRRKGQKTPTRFNADTWWTVVYFPMHYCPLVYWLWGPPEGSSASYTMGLVHFICLKKRAKSRCNADTWWTVVYFLMHYCPLVYWLWGPPEGSSASYTKGHVHFIWYILHEEKGKSTMQYWHLVDCCIFFNALLTSGVLIMTSTRVSRTYEVMIVRSVHLANWSEYDYCTLLIYYCIVLYLIYSNLGLQSIYNEPIIIFFKASKLLLLQVDYWCILANNAQLPSGVLIMRSTRGQ